MKVRIWSDLHISGASLPFDESHSDEVLVIAGDTANSLHGVIDFLNFVSPLFKAVITIAGNHEYYGSFPVDQFTEEVRNKVPSNVHFLDANSVKIDDVTFIGATLWTNFDGGDPVVIECAVRGINDFRLIKVDDDTKISPDWMIRRCIRDLNFIREECKRVEGKKVIVTHFPMVREYQDPKYGSMRENPLNGYFINDFEHSLEDLDFDLVIAGHTHSPSDFMKFGKRFVANPRGYMYRSIPENPKWDVNFVVEV